jgi:hypothetical protein|tara:strand:- start:293 stop:478 length:186 start_codon:yes stop_codon:yes gene_type:complete
MKLKDLTERDNPDRCSAPICRRPSEITYLPGATRVNPVRRVDLCDAHHEEFAELRAAKEVN